MKVSKFFPFAGRPIPEEALAKMYAEEEFPRIMGIVMQPDNLFTVPKENRMPNELAVLKEQVAELEKKVDGVSALEKAVKALEKDVAALKPTTPQHGKGSSK